MKTVNIILGLQVLLPYYNNSDGEHMMRDEYAIIASPTDLPMREESVKAMWKLGWYQPEPLEVDEYAPDRMWIADL